MPGIFSTLSTVWWGKQRHRGGPRRVARQGGSKRNYIPAAQALWALPHNRIRFTSGRTHHRGGRINYRRK